MDILNTLSGSEIMAASDRCDEAIEREFIKHVERIKEQFNLPDHRARIDRRNHVNDDGDVITASWTYVVYGGPSCFADLVPFLIGSVVRETNHSLLSVVDRSGALLGRRKQAKITCSFHGYTFY